MLRNIKNKATFVLKIEFLLNVTVLIIKFITQEISKKRIKTLQFTAPERSFLSASSLYKQAPQLKKM